MSSTNKTTNYELSQFIGTDKPAWLTDYNTDMSKIDGGIHNAQATANSADGKADSANTNIGNLENLTTSTKTSLVSAINEVDGHADLAQETANNVAGAVSTLENYLNISTFNSYATGTTDNGNITTVSVNTASNSGGTLGKVYGYIDVSPSSNNTVTVTLTDKSPFRPSEEIIIKDIGHNSMSNSYIDYPVSAKIGTDGTIQLYGFGLANMTNRFIINPCLLFIKNFGDVVE